MSRRSVIRGSVGVAAAGALARPYIANAQAKTAAIWVGQGFVPAEDAALKKTVADYEKASGNKIDYSIMPFMALNQKSISAMTSGDVPDLIFSDAPTVILPVNAWNDRLVDMTDVVETQKDKFTETALLSASFYNGTTKKRAYYLAPVKQASAPFHVWGDLVEKAGFKMSDVPTKKWDDTWNFFKPVQKELRAKGMRKMYTIGLQITTVGPNDGNNLFYHFLIANGGQDIITKDGKLHTDDPKVREAAITLGRVHDGSLQGRLCAAGGAELERRRRQQRLPRKAVRDEFRRHAFARARGHPRTRRAITRKCGC